jgi:hypothetical protein
MDREQPELIVGTQAKEDSETRLLSYESLNLKGFPIGMTKEAVQRK